MILEIENILCNKKYDVRIKKQVKGGCTILEVEPFNDRIIYVINKNHVIS